MNYFLVSGAPRSGTTLLQQILNTSQEVACFHEYGLDNLVRRVEELFSAERERDAWLEELGHLPEDYATVQNDVTGLEMASTRGLAHDELLIPRMHRDRAAIMRAIFSIASRKEGLKAAGDKCPGVTLERMSSIERTMPGLKLIWIVRKPSDVIRSSLARAAAARLKKDTWHIRSFDEALDEWVRNWENAAAFACAADDRFLALKYEDLQIDFIAQTEKVAAFLGVKNDFRSLFFEEEPNPQVATLTSEQSAAISNRVGNLVSAWPTATARELLLAHPSLPYGLTSGEAVGGPGGHALHHALREGFCAPEEWGAWTIGTRARATLRIRNARPVDRVWVDISLQGYTGGHPDFVFGLSCNGTAMEIIRMDPVVAQNAVVGRIYEVRDGILDITFGIPRPKRPDQQPTDDLRALGLGLRAIRATIM